MTAQLATPDDSDGIGAYFRDVREARRDEAAGRRLDATQQFDRARQLAANHMMTLLRHDESHYQLRHPTGWILNIYPGNRRLYHDANNRGPYIKTDSNWTLIGVVQAAIEAMQSEVSKP